jgi:hypothetical protein
MTGWNFHGGNLRPAVGYGTALPSAPFNGQEFVLVDSTTNPSYQWRFRYNGDNATSYKWEFSGGAPGFAQNTGSSSRTNTAYGDLADAATPTFTVPRAGVYLIDFGAVWALGGSQTAYANIQVNSSTPGDDVDAIQWGDNGGTPQNTGARLTTKTLAASDTLKIVYRSTASSITISRRWMRVTPVRVS